MEPNYAGFWRRSLASLLDNVTWILFFLWIYVWLVGGAFLASDTAGILAVSVFFSLWFNYFAFCEWRWGQTIGKNATGIEVRSIDGARRLTYGQASIRNLLRLVDFFVIGEVMIAATRRKQRLGDLAAKTVVLADRAPRTAQEQTRLMEAGVAPGALDAGDRPSGGCSAACCWQSSCPPLLVAPFDPAISTRRRSAAGRPGDVRRAAPLRRARRRLRLEVQALGRPLRLLGLRPFRLSAIWIMLATLVALLHRGRAVRQPGAEARPGGHRRRARGRESEHRDRGGRRADDRPAGADRRGALLPRVRVRRAAHALVALAGRAHLGPYLRVWYMRRPESQPSSRSPAGVRALLALRQNRIAVALRDRPHDQQRAGVSVAVGRC